MNSLPDVIQYHDDSPTSVHVFALVSRFCRNLSPVRQYWFYHEDDETLERSSRLNIRSKLNVIFDGSNRWQFDIVIYTSAPWTNHSKWMNPLLFHQWTSWFSGYVFFRISNLRSGSKENWKLGVWTPFYLCIRDIFICTSVVRRIEVLKWFDTH